MSLALHDLLICCRQLENKKAVERRVTSFPLVCVPQLAIKGSSNFFFPEFPEGD